MKATFYLIILTSSIILNQSNELLGQDSIYQKILSGESLILHNQEIENLYRITENDLDFINSIDIANGTEELYNLFLPLTIQESIIKNIYSEKRPLNKNEFVQNFLKQIATLESLKEQVTNAHNEVEESFYPFESEEPSNIKIGFVNAFEVLANVIKGLSIKFNENNDSRAVFRPELVPLESLEKVSKTIKGIFLNCKDCNDDAITVIEGALLSRLMKLKDADNIELLDELYFLSNTYEEQRRKRFRETLEKLNIISIASELLGLGDGFDWTDRKLFIDVLEERYYQYRLLLSSFNSSLGEVKNDPLNEETLNNILGPIFNDKELSLFELLINIGNENLAQFDYSKNSLVNRFAGGHLTPSMKLLLVTFSSQNRDIPISSNNILGLNSGTVKYLKHLISGIASITQKRELSNIDLSDIPENNILPDSVKFYIEADTIIIRRVSENNDFNLQLSFGLYLHTFKHNRNGTNLIVSLPRINMTLNTSEIQNWIDEGIIEQLVKSNEKVIIDSIFNNFSIASLPSLNTKIRIGEILLSNAIDNNSSLFNIRDLIIFAFDYEVNKEIESKVRLYLIDQFESKYSDKILDLQESVKDVLEGLFNYDINILFERTNFEKAELQISPSHIIFTLPIEFDGITYGTVQFFIDFKKENIEHEVFIDYSSVLLSKVISKENEIIIFQDHNITDTVLSANVLLKFVQNVGYPLGQIIYNLKSQEIDFNFNNELSTIVIAGVTCKVDSIVYTNTKQFEIVGKFYYHDIINDLNLSGNLNGSEVIKFKISNSGVSGIMSKGESECINAINKFLTDNKVLRESFQITEIIVNQNTICYRINGSECSTVSDMLLEIYKSKIQEVKNYIEAFKNELLSELSETNNEFPGGKVVLKGRDTLNIYFDLFSRSFYTIQIVRNIEKKFEYDINAIIENRIKKSLENTLEFLDQEIQEINDLTYDSSYEAFLFNTEVNIANSIYTLKVRLNLDGKISILNKSEIFNALSKNGRQEIAEQISVLEKKFLETLGNLSNWVDVETNVVSSNFNSSDYEVKLNVKNFIGNNLSEDFISIEGIQAERYGYDNFKFDYSHAKINLDRFNEIIGNFISGSSNESAMYLSRQNDLGEIIFPVNIELPYINFSTEIRAVIDLKTFDTKLDYKEQIFVQVAQGIIDTYFGKSLINKKFNAGGLSFIINDMVVNDDMDLSIGTVVDLGKLSNAKPKLQIIIDKDLNTKINPKNIGEIVGQMAISDITEKAINKLKDIFPPIEEYVSIDSIQAIYKESTDFQGVKIPIGLRIESSAKIYNLFEVGLPPLLFTSHDDIKFEGPKSAKFVFAGIVPLVPPFYLSDIGGSISEEVLKGQTKLIVVDKNVLYLDGKFDIPFNGDARINLNGDLILANQFNLAKGEGVFNFNKATFKADIESSKEYEPIIRFTANADVKAKGNDWRVQGKGQITYLSSIVTKGTFELDKNHFSSTIAADISPLFKNVTATVSAGPYSSHPKLTATTSIDVHGYDIAGLRGTIGMTYGRLAFNFLGVNLSTTVPSYTMFNRDLIWDLIKEILNPDLKNLDKAVKALLSGNININPFSGFGEGGDGISDGDSSDMGTEESEFDESQRNESQEGNPGESNTVSYEQFMKIKENEEILNQYLPSEILGVKVHIQDDGSVTHEEKITKDYKNGIEVPQSILVGSKRGWVLAFKDNNCLKYYPHNGKEEILITGFSYKLNFANGTKGYKGISPEDYITIDAQNGILVLWDIKYEKIQLFSEAHNSSPLEIAGSHLSWSNKSFNKEFLKSLSYLSVTCAIKNSLNPNTSYSKVWEKDLKDGKLVLIEEEDSSSNLTNKKIIGYYNQKILRCKKNLKTISIQNAIPSDVIYPERIGQDKTFSLIDPCE